MKEYTPKTISLGGNRRLINAVKKAGIKTFNPQGPFNGYGYTRLPLAARIESLSDMRKFNKIKKELAEKEPANPAKKTQEEIKMAWAKRLVKLVGDEYELTIEDALKIAQDKLNYQILKINDMIERNYTRGYSKRREALIRKMERANPLRRIRDKNHAISIMEAHYRHNNTPYDEYLLEAHELEEDGFLERGTAKDYAYQQLRDY